MLPSLPSLLKNLLHCLLFHLIIILLSLSVVNRASFKCNTTIWLDAQTTSVYISHYVANHNGPGSVSCPVGVRANAGQKLNVSVYHFNQKTDGQSDNSCPYYAVIVDGHHVNSSPLCNLRDRHDHLTTSNTSQVKFYFYTRQQNMEKSPGFIIKIEGKWSPNELWSSYKK